MKTLRITIYNIVALFKWRHKTGVQKPYVHTLLLACIFLFLLAACNDTTDSNSTNESSEQQVDTIADADNTNEETDETNEEGTSQEVQIAPAECDGIVFEKDAVIDGNQLANCMMAAMLAAKTGSHIVQSTSGSNSAVDFKWDPEFAMSVKSDNISIVLYEDTGWMQLEDGRWIEETDDTLDTDILIATNTIKLTRAFAHPYMITQYLALNSKWKVIDELDVPAPEAFKDVAWKLIPESPINFEGITISDVELYLTDEYLGAYYVATANIMNVKDTTSNTFTQWGGPVTIPEPGGS